MQILETETKIEELKLNQQKELQYADSIVGIVKKGVLIKMNDFNYAKIV